MAGDVTSSVGARVEEIMASARAAADELQHEVEQATAERATAVRLAAADDAQMTLARAEEQAERYLADARRRIDAFAEARIRRITELTDDLSAAAADLPARLADATQVRRQVDELIAALGNAAEQAAREADRPSIRLPRPSGSAPPEDAP